MNCNRFRVHCWLAVVIVSMAISASAEWKEKVLYSFQGGTDGSTPAGGVVFDAVGNLYGATTNGGSSSCRGPFQCGVVYQLKPPAKNGDPWTETVLYVFKGSDSNDGASPFGGLIMDTAGNLFGTTGYDGTGSCTLGGGCGTVFELSPPAQKGGAWTETVIYNFQGNTDGQLPIGDLVFDKQGNLYGATLYGGGHGSCNPSFYKHCGTVFELSPPKTKGGKWTEKVLYSFKGVPAGAQIGDGANPNGGLVLDGKGAIYGATQIGGVDCPHHSGQGCGTVFSLTPPATKNGTWSETVLYRFKNASDGYTPYAGLLLRSGNLFGTTAQGGGGNSGSGTVFRLVPTSNGKWAKKILYSFQDNSDGGQPQASLVFDSGGNLYGSATSGGTVGAGTVFRLRPKAGGSWGFAPLYEFNIPPDGFYPAAGLIFDRIGNIYSTTQNGGTGQACHWQGGPCGTVFEVTP
jgi:uncharacterized repeat protein (TIGR03803 family)